MEASQEFREAEVLGKNIVDLFNLKQIRGKKEPTFETSYGSKTYAGIGRTVLNLTDKNL